MDMDLLRTIYGLKLRITYRHNESKPDMRNIMMNLHPSEAKHLVNVN